VERNHISGAGWHLVLNDGWHAVPADNGCYIVTKQ